MWKEIESTNIYAARVYEEHLLVAFKSGIVYLYENVAKEFDNLINNSKPGRFVHTNLKNNYKSQKKKLKN